ncbi:DUF3108 domain-containing protein [Wenzhouxiangella sp. XN79A]|uniref:DUF3108 domain-containing protein n=1 Tax=Wenzhouxiangella sp. XN79A TaxID=2724193 RepID=UPI00144AF643|nr:DUF3108 domain-containing protein [Wenzhouxiangella sp. XN79A]NKI34343.1 DUF3108 domain-containing protein [Wenzhouxiangella sp. XN79A]
MQLRPLRWCWIATWTLTVAGATLAALLPLRAPAAESGADAAPFREHSAVYRVTRNGKELGRMNAELSQREDGLWYYRVDSEATAFLVRMLGVSTFESGWFDWRDGQIVPLTYHHVSRRPGKDRFWQHRYDWGGLHTDTLTHDGETRVPLARGALDPLTLRLAVASALPEAAERDAGLDVLVVERDELETQQIRFLRRTTIELAGRCFDTAVIERFRKPGSSRNYLAWHAAELDWIPVRTVHHEDDDRLVIELIEYSPSDRLPPPGGDCPRPVDSSGKLP